MADFGYISTKVKGTVGYLDPEYMRTNELTPKSDVYSLGILLLEIVTGRRPLELKRSVEERVTLRWVTMFCFPFHSILVNEVLIMFVALFLTLRRPSKSSMKEVWWN